MPDERADRLHVRERNDDQPGDDAIAPFAEHEGNLPRPARLRRHHDKIVELMVHFRNQIIHLLDLLVAVVRTLLLPCKAVTHFIEGAPEFGRFAHFRPQHPAVTPRS